MKANKKAIIISFIIGILIVGGIVTYFLVNDENKLTVDEKRWINDNLTTVQNVNVINDVNIYGKNGHGVFYDFLTDFSSEYNLRINPVITGEAAVNVFKETNSLTDNSLVFAEDHYVLVSKDKEIIERDVIKSLNIGYLNKDKDYLNSFIMLDEGVGYEDSNSLFNDFHNDVIEYILVPRNEYIDEILSNNYVIVKHLNDIKEYFVYEMDINNPMSGIIKKYYNSWKKDLRDSIYRNMYTDFTEALSLSNKDIDALTANIYDYGFVSNSPYEILMGGNYGGIVGEYLKSFSDFSGVEFNFTRYKSASYLKKALNKKIDIYFDYFNIDSTYYNIDSRMQINYVIIAPIEDDVVITSLEGLRDREVYALENSVVIDDLKNISGIKLNTYSSLNNLFKIVKKNKIIVLDRETYNYYAGSKFKSYTLRYEGKLDTDYNFKFRESNVLSKFFNSYVNYLDPEEMITRGLYNHDVTLREGTFLGTIAKYSLYIILGAVIVMYFIYKRGKKVTISKRIKKADKIRYIDQLTSLKNRNYLNENIAKWNKNTIYPQAIIIVDLDKIQEINDTLGYEEGDKQIKAAANILIKTQLDNSDIIRTNGNEFMIYLVEYTSKQVTSYIRKLYKEIKELPHDYGVTITYSMILDDTKMIEDAINEAVDDMKMQKQVKYEE